MRSRVSGESARFDESITILSRDLRSATEITSSLTTAAIRVSVIWPSGDCAAGRCVAGAPGGDPVPERARAALAWPDKQINPTSPTPSQQIKVIALDLAVMSPTEACLTAAHHSRE